MTELLRSVARITGASCCFCILVEEGRLEIGPRHGITAAAIDSLLSQTSPLVEAALVHQHMRLDRPGALCLPLELSAGQPGALYVGRQADDAPLPPLERELLLALAEQMGCALAARHAQGLLTRLRTHLDSVSRS